MADGAGEHPGPKYFGDLPCIWNAYLFHVLAYLPLLLRSILPALTRTFIEK